MCTAFLAFGISSELLFFLAFNRDEFIDRETAPLHWWDDQPEILGGRDLVRKGTWLGISKSGRFALLTNFREPLFNQAEEGRSRGELPVDFLKSRQSPLEYAESIDTKAYNGFNLIVGNFKAQEVVYLTNRGPSASKALPLEPGLYGISNGNLESNWPKVDRGKQRLQQLLKESNLSKEEFPWEDIQKDVLGHSVRVKEASDLPQTGMGEEVERAFSSILIEPMEFKGKEYGTRSKTVMTAWKNGSVDVREWTLCKDLKHWHVQESTFDVS